MNIEFLLQKVTTIDFKNLFTWDLIEQPKRHPNSNINKVTESKSKMKC